MPVWHRNFLGLRHDASPKSIKVVELLLDGKLVESGRGSDGDRCPERVCLRCDLWTAACVGRSPRACPPNALPFSCKPAAESAPQFYTDVPAAGLSVCNGIMGSTASSWTRGNTFRSSYLREKMADHRGPACRAPLRPALIGCHGPPCGPRSKTNSRSGTVAHGPLVRAKTLAKAPSRDPPSSRPSAS